MVTIGSNLRNGSAQKAGAGNKEATKLHANTKLGYVYLTISDMDRSVDF
jgi:hypothetical protein